MRPAKYIRLFFYGFVCTLSLAMASTYVIDPYQIFLTPEIKGISEKKPRAQGEIFFNRIVGIQSNKPKTILLGNSRVQWGVRAGSDSWPKAYQPVYNAAIPGSNNQTAYAYLKYAIETGNIKTVVLGLDYFSSLIKETADPGKPVVLGDYEPLLAAQDNLAKSLKSYFLRLGAIDGLIDSVMTVFLQKDPYAPDILPNGDNPLNEYKGYVAEKGQYKLFEEPLAKARIRLASKRKIFIPENDSSPEFESLKRLIALCDRNGVALYMYFHPYHSSLQDLILSGTRKVEFQKWKRRIISLIGDRNNIVLWDFGGRSRWTSEPVPKAGDTTTQMKWYWEPGHYKASLGDVIISRMFGDSPVDSSRSFGKKIYPK